MSETASPPPNMLREEAEKKRREQDSRGMAVIALGGRGWLLVGGPVITLGLIAVAPPEAKPIAACLGVAAWFGPLVVPLAVAPY